MPDISAVKNLPDVSFIDGKTVEDIRGEMVADYEAYMSQATGRPLTLDRASPHRMELYAAAAQIYHALQYIDRAGNGFRMNKSNTNSGGWNGSYGRKEVLGNSGTPTSPPANSLLAALPADLRAVMKPVTKYSDNTGGGSDNASYVTATNDYLFDLSEFEVQGSRTYANSAEKNYQLQYAYFKAGNSKITYNHGNTGTAVWCFSRSVYYGSTSYFCMTYTDGSASSADAYYSGGRAPGFTV